MSNAVCHTPGADIAVRVAIDEAAVDVSVINRPSNPNAAFEALPVAGLGLAGIRERVRALTGTIDARPTADGRFVLLACLPFE